MWKSLRIFILGAVLAANIAYDAAQDGFAFHEETFIAEFPAGTYFSRPPAGSDGETVVWGVDDPEGVTIYGVRLSDDYRFRIAKILDRDVRTPDIDVDGDLVAWSEDRGGDHDGDLIRAKRLSTGELFTVAGSDQGTVESPSVWGNWIVWLDTRQSTASIMARNLEDMSPSITLASGASGTQDAPGDPMIDDGWIVWGEAYKAERNAFSAFVAQRVGEQAVSLRVDAGNIQHAGSPSLEDGILAFPLASNAASHEGELPEDTAIAHTNVVDLATGHVRTVTVQFSNPGGPHKPYADFSVATDGRYVLRPFVISSGTPTAGSKVKVMAYDLQTNSYFAIGSWVRWWLHVEDGWVTWVARLIHNGEVHAAPLKDLLPTAPRPNVRPESDDYTFYPETQHYLQYGLKAFWERSGGLPVFGFPMTEEFQERSPDADTHHTVQYFERQRFEWHPENAGTPYEVLLGRLGVQLLATQGRDWTALPQGDPQAAHYFPETGHAIGPEFYEYWSQHGLEFGDEGASFRESLALFGYPISEPMRETNADGDTVLTQWFERAVFEYHPDNPPESQVLLRRVGSELLEARGW